MHEYQLYKIIRRFEDDRGTRVIKSNVGLVVAQRRTGPSAQKPGLYTTYYEAM